LTTFCDDFVLRDSSRIELDNGIDTVFLFVSECWKDMEEIEHVFARCVVDIGHRNFMIIENRVEKRYGKSQKNQQKGKVAIFRGM
jgi:hypothetical protein